MNRFISAVLMFVMLGINPVAYADGWHDDDHGHRAWHGHRYYPVPVRPYYPYYPQHKNNDNKSNWPAYVVGGLVLGALLTNAFPGSRPTAYDNAEPSSPPTSAQGRRLFRDANGNCYERQADGAGNELSTELPPSACNW